MKRRLGKWHERNCLYHPGHLPSASVVVLAMERHCNLGHPPLPLLMKFFRDMDQSNRGVKLGRFLFPLHPPRPLSMNEKLEKIGEPRIVEFKKENMRAATCYSPLEIPNNFPLEVPKVPDQAMEFLSRTWNPNSSDFFNMLSSNSIVSNLVQISTEEMLEIEGTQESKTQCNAWLYNGSTISAVNQKHKSYPNSWASVVEILSSLKNRKKGKEERRRHLAQVNAALSVARLAAGVAGILANSRLEPKILKDMDSISFGEDWHKKINSVMASAAALIATVCAEAAESVGAHRTRVASAIDMGLATRTSADILELTAAAATCLRGASMLEVIPASIKHISEDQNILSRGALLPVRIVTGKAQVRTVCIYLKHYRLMLRLGKKYLKGAVTTYKEYRVVAAMEDKDDHQFYMIALGTIEGTIQMLFQDQKQFRGWMSAISHLLKNY